MLLLSGLFMPFIVEVEKLFPAANLTVDAKPAASAKNKKRSAQVLETIFLSSTICQIKTAFTFSCYSTRS